MKNPDPLHSAILPPKLAQALRASAKALRRVPASAAATSRPTRVGATLRPGKDTPLWNALVASLAPRLKTRGAQAALARQLGLQRQQINAFFRQHTRMPDAERTLQLLAWLQTPPSSPALSAPKITTKR